MRKPTWGDCSVRALASAKGYSYGVAQMKLKEYRASDRSGIGTNEWINHLIFKEGFDLVVNYEKAFIKARKECREEARKTGRLYYEILREKGCYKWTDVSPTLNQAINMYEMLEEGTWIVDVKSHTFCIKDGVIYGNGRSEVALRKRVWMIAKL